MLGTLAVDAQVTTYVSNLGNVSSNIATVTIGQSLASKFTTGINPAGYTLGSIQVLLNPSSGNPSGLSFSIYTDAGGVPGSSLCALSGNAYPTPSELTPARLPASLCLPRLIIGWWLRPAILNTGLIIAGLPARTMMPRLMVGASAKPPERGSNAGQTLAWVKSNYAMFPNGTLPPWGCSSQTDSSRSGTLSVLLSVSGIMFPYGNINYSSENDG